jgi:N-acetylneuraminic acid mutarotase
MSKHWRLSVSMFGFLFGFVTISLSARAQTTGVNEWTWMGGSSTVGSGYGHLGVYGTLGTPTAGNIPGSRYSAATWTDRSGHLWLFGGVGYYSTNESWGFFNDLWEFDPASNEWAWMGGESSPVPATGYGQPGVYGTFGVPAAGNIPGGRNSASTWTDTSGNLWLFGGIGSDANGNDGWLNDLWEFNPNTNEWAWMGGNNTVGAGYFGSNGTGQPGVYGTLGTPAIGNTPGGRALAARWTDNDGNLWLFGGGGYDAHDTEGLLNDLWEFNKSSNEWAWMGGSTIPSSSLLLGIYGTLGTPAAGNIPGARDQAASWTDPSGNLWLFGGIGYDPSNVVTYFNDLWEFDKSSNEWAWMGGNSTIPTSGVLPGVYGALGTYAAGNIPGGRDMALIWMDESGHSWLFGGQGFDADGNFGTLNDLWEFDPSSNEWTWMSGSSVLTLTVYGVYDKPGVYGTLGMPAAGNIPGSRDESMSWSDSNGNLWLFGGWGYDASGTVGDGLNDLWRYQPSLPATATPIISPGAGTYASVQSVSLSDTTPGAAIYYTTDGTTPKTGSTVYADTIQVSSSETIRALAVASGYSGSAVASATYTINLPVPDFTVAANPTSLSVTAGQSGTMTLSVSPLYGFNSVVSFNCSGLLSGAACKFSPATVTPSGATVSTTLTVVTSTTAATLRHHSNPFLPSSALAVVFCCIGWKKRRCLPMLLALSMSGIALLAGCGGASNGQPSSPQPVTSTISVTAASGSLRHVTTFTLTVN